MLQVSVFLLLKLCFPAKLFKINLKYCFRVKICVLKFGLWGVMVVILKIAQVAGLLHLIYFRKLNYITSI